MRIFYLALTVWTMCAPLLMAQVPTPPDPCLAPTDISTYIKCQKGYAGVGWLLQGDKARYATTSWSVMQLGQRGVKIAQPSAAHDYFDPITPMVALANQRAPRYGNCFVLHAGNIWDDARLPAAIQSHVSTVALPDFVLAYCALLPNQDGVNLSLKYIRPWQRDGMMQFTWSFGGS